MKIPRPEYPRPQFVRTDWLCLNGEWEFEIDHADTGKARGLLTRPLRSRITIPFCPESVLCGIGEVDFMEVVWYRREVTIPEAWKTREVLLHFQAVDYDTTVWVNGQEAVRHRGGHTPFYARLTPDLVADGKAQIVVRARDSRQGIQPRGKQSGIYENHACFYTRTTGIWQTVWMEPVPETHLLRPRITPMIDAGGFLVEQALWGRPVAGNDPHPLAARSPFRPPTLVSGRPSSLRRGDRFPLCQRRAHRPCHQLCRTSVSRSGRS